MNGFLSQYQNQMGKQTDARKTKPLRGSRKHLLDLVESSDFGDRMKEILAPANIPIGVGADRQPSGRQNMKEIEIPAFCRRYCTTSFDLRKLDGWWLPTARADKGATWDLLSTCSIEGRNGLLLVEAKAHEEELDHSGKRLKPTASAQSKINHAHIRAALTTISEDLHQRLDGKINIAIDTHYQLANRIAWAWKLTQSGVPVVLLYLGFLGDTYFADHFRDHDHWQRAIGAYMNGVLPLALPGKVVRNEEGVGFIFMIASLPVVTPSERGNKRTPASLLLA